VLERSPIAALRYGAAGAPASLRSLMHEAGIRAGGEPRVPERSPIAALRDGAAGAPASLQSQLSRSLSRMHEAGIRAGASLA